MLIAWFAASTALSTKDQSGLPLLQISSDLGTLYRDKFGEVYRMDMRTQITQRIQAAFPDATITLADVTGGGDHWEAMIVSPTFEGMSRLQRQRGVYAALGELMHGPIHALTFRTLTPEQFDAEN